MDADERIGAGEVGEVDPRLELVAGADAPGLLEARVAVAVHVAPGRAVAAELGVVVAGERHVAVADHDHADAVGLQPVAQALGDGEGQRLLGQLDAALGRVGHAPVEAAAVAGVDGHHDRAGVRARTRALSEPGRRLDGAGARLGVGELAAAAGRWAVGDGDRA